MVLAELENTHTKSLLQHACLHPSLHKTHIPLHHHIFCYHILFHEPILTTLSTMALHQSLLSEYEFKPEGRERKNKRQ